MENYLYLCSSMRHMYLAMGLAQSWPQINHHLVVINQKAENPTAQVLVNDTEPFRSVEIFRDRRGVWGKYLSKRHCMARLKESVEHLRPAKVFGGNDRRVEFQRAMLHAQAVRPDVIGAYLDDGTGSYINGVYFDWWRSVVDLTFDRALKRVFYGRWYDKQRLLGGTRWVSECYLNFPELAPNGLSEQKTIVKLEPETFRSPAFTKLLERFVDAYDTAGTEAFSASRFYQRYDAFLILPHSKSIAAYFSSTQDYNQIVNRYLQRFESVAVKYHPRETHFYFESETSVTVFPASLPAEIVFSFIQVDHVVGDLSSALLSAIWLLPNSRVVCLCPDALKSSPVLCLIERTSVDIVYC